MSKTLWRMDAYDDHTWMVRDFFTGNVIRIFDHYPTEEEVESAIAMSRVMS